MAATPTATSSRSTPSYAPGSSTGGTSSVTALVCMDSKHAVYRHFKVPADSVGENDTKVCAYCNFKFAGGVYRCAQHITGLNGMRRREVHLCTAVPKTARDTAKALYESKLKAREEKRVAEIAAVGAVNGGGSDKKSNHHADHPLWRNVVSSIQRAGQNYIPPKRRCISGAGLAKCRQRIEAALAPISTSWRRDGVTVASDMFSDKAGRLQANVLLINDSGAVFVESIDTKMEMKTGGYIAGILRPFIEKCLEEAHAHWPVDCETVGKWSRHCLLLSHTLSIPRMITHSHFPLCAPALPSVARQCLEEAHRPVDCETVGKWILKNSAESENMNWILANSKSCPKCKRPIEKNQGCMHMTCTPPCKYEFCWLCLGAWSEHGEKTGGFYACNRYESAKHDGVYDETERRREMAKNSLEKYTHYYERWAANEQSRVKALESLREMQTVKVWHGAGRLMIVSRGMLHCLLLALGSWLLALGSWLLALGSWLSNDAVCLTMIEQLSERHSQPVSQLKFVIDAWLQVVECRRVLKWTYAYGYYLPEAEVARRQFFEYLQGEADTALENLHKMAEKELELYICDDGDPPPTSFNDFRSRLAGLTSGGGADHKMAEKELELYFCDDGDPPPTSFNDFRSLLAGLTSSRRDDGRDGEAAQSDLCHAFLPLTPLHGIYCLAGGTRRGPHSLLPPTLPTFHPPFRPPPTSVTHTYFENLVRALENGLADVENASTAASSTRAAAAAAAAAAGRAIASTSRISQSRFGARTRSRTTAASAATASTSAAGSSAAGPSGSSAGAAAVGGGSGAGSSRGSIFRSSSSQAAAAAAAAAVAVGNTGGRDREETAYWSCEHCTYANPLPGRACAMCHLPRSTQ
ncbi:unnamed protein product [Closterium sp. NIES-53]